MLRGLVCVFVWAALAGAQTPRFVRQGNGYQFQVDGKPYIMLGAQVRNSSGWPGPFEQLLPAAEALHLNTIEVPVYWEDIEPREGEFRFDTFDRILALARERHFRLVLLWFGTWKNGEMDYAPEWVKRDTKRFPRMMDRGGSPVRVLTPLSETNLDADRRAFARLMAHLKDADRERRTVILVQVENEPGSLGTERDFSADANRRFASNVPAELHTKPGTWKEVYGAEADEAFAAYWVARYVNAVAEAGKREYDTPMYANVWLREQKNFMRPGEAYPSGGATSNMLALWKAVTPALDAIAPDNYVLDYVNYQKALAKYRRKDNPLLVPETGGPRFASNLFYALGEYGAAGYAFFGLDAAAQGGKVRELAEPFAEDCRLLGPALPFLAGVQNTGRLHAAVEEENLTERLIGSAEFDVLVQFGNAHPEYGGTFGTQTPAKSGRALVAEIAPDEFLAIGFDARIDFRPARGRAESHAQILRAEEGTFVDGEWKAFRRLNGDEAFFGIRLPAQGAMVKVKLSAY